MRGIFGSPYSVARPAITNSMRFLLALITFGLPIHSQLIAPGFFVHKAGALTCAIVFRSNTPYSVQTYCYTFVNAKPHYWHNTIDEVNHATRVDYDWCLPSGQEPAPTGCTYVSVQWLLRADLDANTGMIYEVTVFANGQQQPQIVGTLDTVYGSKPAVAGLGTLVNGVCKPWGTGFHAVDGGPIVDLLMYPDIPALATLWHRVGGQRFNEPTANCRLK